MKKKLLAVLMTGIMAASFAGTATSVYACLLYTSPMLFSLLLDD